jgi:hypothetical protein
MQNQNNMSPKMMPVPQVAVETMAELLGVAMEFADREPWLDMYDNQIVGLIANAATGEIRLASVLGNNEEVFAASIYRGPMGIRWLLDLLLAETVLEFDAVEGLDALKFEMVTKPELVKEDRAWLKAQKFKAMGNGVVWPQFRSLQPGFMPWFINQTEAEQLLTDLWRLNSFHELLIKNPDLYDGRAPNDIPFLPHPFPERPLKLEDLDWRRILPPTVEESSFQASREVLDRLSALPRLTSGDFDYGCAVLPGCEFVENGRTCFGRMGLLIEHRGGLALGSQLTSAAIPFSQSAGESLIQMLLKHGSLPSRLLVSSKKLEAAVRPLCDALRLQLEFRPELLPLAEATNSLISYMMSGKLP